MQNFVKIRRQLLSNLRIEKETDTDSRQALLPSFGGRNKFL